MKLHDIRKREILKEKGRLKAAAILETKREYLNATRRNTERIRIKAEEYGSDSDKANYHAQVEWYKKILNEYKKEKYEYKNKYKFN
ncbi:MAG: hypothetical protein D3916_17035, partial [Candidatus Electrothrix sp. MAN1_4]|nr:hypothetical protein [Candidatus Electrothrix sp. MAN1_4]